MAKRRVPTMEKSPPARFGMDNVHPGLRADLRRLDVRVHLIPIDVDVLTAEIGITYELRPAMHATYHASRS